MLYINRKNIRLKNFDYSEENAYFITICTKNRKRIFWENKTIFELNEFGNIVMKHWMKIPQVYDNVMLDEFVIMPNHIHGIIIIEDKKLNAIGNIINQYKTSVTKEIRQVSSDNKLEIWQRNYYEHIIREREIDRIRCYIANNPHNIYKDRYC